MTKLFMISLFLSCFAIIFSLVGALPTVSKRDTIPLQGFQFPADTELANNIASAFTDAMELVKTVVDTAAWNAPTFDLYFAPETRDGIATTFRNILRGASSQLVFDNTPKPDGQDPQHRDVCVTKTWAAFATNGGPRPTIHFCPSTWKYPKPNDVAAKVCEGSQVTIK
ncbi:MAG: hypothetical protein Q9172_007410 [Xanthocarpia lactea]